MASSFSTRSGSRSWRVASRTALALVAASVGAACSLINAFDDVKPQVAVSVPDTGLQDANVEASAEAGDAGAATGVVVVGGQAETDAGKTAVLTAVDPATGAELPMAREKMLVAAVHYDGLRDLWYVFESNGATHFPTPTDNVFLHVRKLDTHTGKWEEIQSIKVPTLVANTHVAVLRDRIAYIAYRTTSDGSLAQDLVVIDTTSPPQPTVASSTPLAGDPIGIIGTRATTTAGGHVTLLFHVAPAVQPDAGCGGGTCFELETQLVTVGAEGVPSLGVLTDRALYGGSPAFGSFGASTGLPTDYLGFVKDPPTGTLQGFNPSTALPTGSAIGINTNDAFLRPIAFADCLGQALLIGTNTETAVTAVPVAAAGAGDRKDMGHSGQSVHFDPFTSTVLAPFTQGEGYELTAFKLSGTAGAPKLTLRQAPDWTPPPGLRPEIVSTRIPIPFQCVP
jgi:hypothetical protein